MSFNLLLTQPYKNRIPAGIDDVLLTENDLDKLSLLPSQEEKNEYIYDRLWERAYHAERENPETIAKAFSFYGGRGLLEADPEWDGSDAMPLVFKKDADIHLYGNSLGGIFGKDEATEEMEQAMPFFETCGIHVSLSEQAPKIEINASITDRYDIQEATDGALLSKDMPEELVMNPEELRKQIMEKLTNLISEKSKGEPVAGIQVNVYANGPKTATVEVFNSMQLLGDKAMKDNVVFAPYFYHRDRETGEYFDQRVLLACKRKCHVEELLDTETKTITFEICKERHGENPLAKDGAVYDTEIPEEHMKDPELVQFAIEDFVYDKEMQALQQYAGSRFLDFHLSDVASGASMPLVAFLNAATADQTPSSVFQYDRTTGKYIEQTAITRMFYEKERERIRDLIEEVDRKDIVSHPQKKQESFEMEI